MTEEILSACIGCSSDGLVRFSGENKTSLCDRCGLLFDNPRPSASAIQDFYSRESQYDGWLAELSERDRLWRRRLAKMLGANPKRGALLDVGAGIGQFLNHARSVFENVTGTEVSSSAIEIAYERYGLNLVEGNLEDISSLNKKFSVVTAFHVLEHVPFPGKFLSRCFNLLEEGGLLVLAVPNDVHTVGSRLRRLFRLFRIGKYARYTRLGLPPLILDGSIHEIHLSHFTKKSLTSLVSDHGFLVEQTSLDPFFVARGWKLFRFQLLYRIFSWIHSITGVNLYGTLWVVARKPAT